MQMRSLRKIAQFNSTNRRNIAAMKANKNKPSSEFKIGKIELDSHADTIVAGSNCIVMHYTGRECDVSPYTKEYKPIQDVPIVQAATAWQSPESGQLYILIFNEALWMGDTLDHTLVNPNQLRHYGITVQDNPACDKPLYFMTEDSEFSMELKRKGTIIYSDTFTPSAKELNDNPKIIMSSPHPWDPTKVTFNNNARSLEEEISEARGINSIEVQNFAPCIFNSGELNHRLIKSVESHDRIVSTIATRRIISGSNKANPNISRETINIGSNDLPVAYTFQSSKRHNDVTPEDLSERWCISLNQAASTIKRTTQNFLRSAILPIARRYRADRMFQRKTLVGDWSTDTLDGRIVSLNGNKYAQVFANKSYFAKIYPMDSKSKCGEALKIFCQEFGVPERLTFDGSKEQTKKGTSFMKQVRSNGITHHIAEPNMHKQNPVEGVIREIRKKWFRIMIRKRVPRKLWDYGMVWVTEIMSMTHTTAGGLDGSIPITKVTGETTDISEYLDFGFYDKVWYRDNAGLDESKPGRWLGVSEYTGNLMCYHILNRNGEVVSRSTVQRVTALELQTVEHSKTFDEFETAIRLKLKENRTYLGAKPNPADWGDYFEDDEDFHNEFNRIFDDEDIAQADDFTPEVMEDTYLNMELAMPRDDTGPEFAKVTKRLRDANGNPIGKANDNPLLDTRIYEVEYSDGHKASLAANSIAINLFSQVDQEGHRHVIFDQIIDHRTDGSELSKEDGFIKSKNGGRRRKESTKGWEILLQWKDGSTTWETLKSLKECYPVQLAEYATLCSLLEEPAFAWWVPHVISKRKSIVAKIKSKYWTRTHKFGIRIPKNVKQARELDADDSTGLTLWWDAILKEMRNVRIAFEEFAGTEQEIPPGYQYVDCHMIFDIKMGENFRRKARMVAGGHQTVTPAALTYASVVSRDSVRICLTIAALNGLKVLACDIQNAYLTAMCREKIWTIAGPEFGSDAGKIMLITRALYGLKSSGAAFRALLSEVIWDLGYRPSRADPDVYMRPAVKPDGSKYWEYVLTYVDDVLCISNNPKDTMDGIQNKFKLKDDKIEEPSVYLGASLTKMTNINKDECWAMSSDPYCQAAVKNLETTLAKKNLRLPSKCLTPLSNGYRPEMDVTQELKADGVQYYQELIGILRWAVEIGRVDILLEVALLSQHLALPRQGHLEQVLHIFGYLKSHKKLRLMFDPSQPRISSNRFKEYDWEEFYKGVEEAIPPNMPEERGLPVSVSVFVDSDLAGDKANRRSQTGILIFINRAPIHWYSKRQPSVEASTFGAEFRAMKISVEMVEALRYKLRMFGIPIDGPASVFCDNEAVYKNTVMPESVLRKKHHSIAYHRCREAVAAKTIQVAKEGTDTNLADLFTKLMTSTRRSFLLERFTY